MRPRVHVYEVRYHYPRQRAYGGVLMTRDKGEAEREYAICLKEGFAATLVRRPVRRFYAAEMVRRGWRAVDESVASLGWW